MAVAFQGRWRGRVMSKNAGFAQRVKVNGAAAGSGTYPGVVGTTFDVDGPNWSVALQWNDGVGSGWQNSAVTDAMASTSPLVIIRILRGDDNVPGSRDGDFDDLVVTFESLDPPFSVPQRPFALDRGTLTMLPDGIFEAGQGVQYMGVRIRNEWFFDWDSGPIGMGMKIGIAPASRVALAGQGITVLDTWTPMEQRALGQVVDGDFVRVEDLAIGQERMIYFKLDFSGAGAGTPEVGFVAQRDSWDNAYDAPSRVVRKKIFVTRLAYDAANKELIADVPEATLRLRLTSAIVDRRAANRAAALARDCLLRRPGSTGRRRGSGSGRRESIAELKGIADELRRLLAALLAGKDIDPCRLKEILDRCEEDKCACDEGDGKDDGGRDDTFPGGGLGDGSGADDWCRVRSVAWLPLGFEYKIEYRTPFGGQFGPLAFEDPWWKVALIILAVLLAIASVIADYVGAANDDRFVIGKVARRADAATTQVDGALGDLNGSRGIDQGHLDAQGDDVNNGLPIVSTGGIIPLDRSDNGDFGLQDALEGDIVWKSGGTSGTTRGVVTDTGLTTTINYDETEFMSGDITFQNQVLVSQIVGSEQPLSQGGDSGSVWVNLATARPTALNFAGPSDDSGLTGIGNPIRLVADTLGIRFNP